MAGTEHSTRGEYVPNLFDQKCTVLIDVEDSDADALNLVERLYHSIPMSIVHLDGRSLMYILPMCPIFRTSVLSPLR